jgi:hypothetical protein
MWLLREHKVWNQYVLCVGLKQSLKDSGPENPLTPAHTPLATHTQHIHHGLIFQALRIQKAMRCKTWRPLQMW